MPTRKRGCATHTGHDLPRSAGANRRCSTALYGFNLGGYKVAAIDAGKTNRIEFGGLTDATFRTVPLLEAGRNAAWPWL